MAISLLSNPFFMIQPGVLEQMDRHIQQWQAGTDGRAIFLACYRTMTHNMLQALERREFTNSDWTSSLLDRFAGYYFAALEAYESQAPRLPAVWRFAFDAAGSDNMAPIQKLLLGVNAHINYDLVLTLRDLLEKEWPSLPEIERLHYYNDYCYVNRIISATIDTVQDKILEPAQPSMRLVDDLMGNVDEWLVGRLITHWRDKVWGYSRMLLAAQTDAAKHEIVDAVEKRALQRAEAIAGRRWPLSIKDIL